MPSSRKTKEAKPRKKRTKLRIALYSILGFFLVLLIGGGIFVGYAAATTPAWDPSALNDLKQSSTVYDINGDSIGSINKGENRILVTSAQIPELVKQTFVAVEDKRFYEHIGVDPIRIVGAAINDIRSRSTNEGASTITIQLARNAFLANPTEKKFTRKIQEAVLAIQLERKYTKDEILTFYLNQTFFGQSSYGIQAAAQTYFGVDLKDLTPDQIAMLAGLPQAPSQYNPYIHPEAAKNRRTITLGVMRQAGLITAEDYEKYKVAPFTYIDNVKSGSTQDVAATSMSYKFPWFVDYVIEELENTYKLTAAQIYNGGLKIYTTVNPKIQTAAETVFADSDNFPESDDDKKLIQGAMTIIEPSTGAVQAMVGGREYTARGLNRASDQPRQPGSTIKPLVVYGPAIEKGGYFTGTVLDDMPVSYGSYAPTDYDTESSGWKGLITMRTAVENSVNVYAVKLLSLIGVDYGWAFGKDKLGLPLEEGDKHLALALGTPLISTKDMTAAYAIYANNGVSVTTHSVVKVLDAKENVLISPEIKSTRVMKETTAYVINNLLRSVVTNGTGKSAQIGNWAVAGKTGTTNLDPAYFGNAGGNNDAWFAGYTPQYAGVVWMGYDSAGDNHEYYLHHVYGGGFPAQVWKKVMTAALADLPVQTAFTQPDGIVSVTFDSKTGLLPSSLTPSEFVQSDIAVQGSEPTGVSDVWIQKPVDVTHPDMLATTKTLNTLQRTFLNISGRDPAWTWPSDELPYKVPTESAPDPVLPPVLPPTQPAAG